MGNIPALTPREVEKILLRAGFFLDTKRGSHKTYYNPETNRHTTIAFHRGSLPTGTLRAIIKQSGLSIEKFLSLRK